MRENKTYMAFVRFFTSVPSDMNNQHIHGFEGFFFSATTLPVARTILLIFLNVFGVNMMHQLLLVLQQHATLFPPATKIFFVFTIFFVISRITCRLWCGLYTRQKVIQIMKTRQKLMIWQRIKHQWHFQHFQRNPKVNPYSIMRSTLKHHVFFLSFQ